MPPLLKENAMADTGPLRPATNRTISTYLVDALRAEVQRQTPYTELNCVTLPLKYLRPYLSPAERKDFVNGGTLLERYQTHGGSLTLLSPDALKRATFHPGTLLVRCTPAKDAAELEKFYALGDFAIYVDKKNAGHLIKDRKEAVRLLKDGEGTVLLSRHYLTISRAEFGGGALIHASSAKGKVVEQTLEEYFARAGNRASQFIAVDLAVAFPTLAPAKF